MGDDKTVEKNRNEGGNTTNGQKEEPKKSSWLGDRLTPISASNNTTNKHRDQSPRRNHNIHSNGLRADTRSPRPAHLPRTPTKTPASTPPPPPRQPPPPPPRAQMERKKNSWVFSQSEIFTESPSVKAGIPFEEESVKRAKGINAMIKAGGGLKLPEITINTGSTFFHRFFVRHSFKEFHYYEIAGAALLLATKITEHHRKLRDFAVLFTKIAQHNPKLNVDEQSPEYWKWRNSLVLNEEHLLETLCFDLTLDDPYAILKDILVKYGLHNQKYFRRASQQFVNDACRTVLYLLYPTQTVVATAVYWASHILKTPVENKETGKPFWEDLEIEENQLVEACDLIADIYSPLFQKIPDLDKECQPYTRISDTGSETPYDSTANNTPAHETNYADPSAVTPSKRKTNNDNEQHDDTPKVPKVGEADN